MKEIKNVKESNRVMMVMKLLAVRLGQKTFLNIYKKVSFLGFPSSLDYILSIIPSINSGIPFAPWAPLA